MTNKTLIVSAVLSLILTGLHVFGGGPDVHIPLLESNASAVVKGFASVVWHSITVALLLGSLMLFIAARNEVYRSVLTWLVIGFYTAFAGPFVFYGIVRFGNILVMPPWIGFVVIVSVAYIGLSISARTRCLITASGWLSIYRFGGSNVFNKSCGNTGWWIDQFLRHTSGMLY